MSNTPANLFPFLFLSGQFFIVCQKWMLILMLMADCQSLRSELLLKSVRNFPSMASNTDYGRPMKPFFIEIPGFKADVVVARKDGKNLN